MSKFAVGFEDYGSVPCSTAADAVRLATSFAEGKSVHMKGADEQSRKEIVDALDQKVWEGQGRPMLFG